MRTMTGIRLETTPPAARPSLSKLWKTMRWLGYRASDQRVSTRARRLRAYRRALWYWTLASCVQVRPPNIDILDWVLLLLWCFFCVFGKDTHYALLRRHCCHFARDYNLQFKGDDLDDASLLRS